jgi:hypothetical protein
MPRERALIKGEVGGSSQPRPGIYFSRLMGVVPRTSAHNPTHTYLTTPHLRRGDSQRGEIFSLRRQNHLEANHQIGSEAQIVLMILRAIAENWRRFANSP